MHYAPISRKTVSVLLNTSSIASTSGGWNFDGKADYLSLLGELGNAVAIGSEAGEDVDEVSTGYLDLKVCWFATRRSRAQTTGCWCATIVRF